MSSKKLGLQQKVVPMTKQSHQSRCLFIRRKRATSEKRVLTVHASQYFSSGSIFISTPNNANLLKAVGEGPLHLVAHHSESDL